MPSDMDGMTTIPTWVLWLILGGYVPMSGAVAFLFGVIRTLYRERTEDGQAARKNDLEVQRSVIESQRDSTEAARKTVEELRRLRSTIERASKIPAPTDGATT